MVLWKSKSCPKCGGDLFLDIDEEVWFDHCLQCGYTGQKSRIVCPECGNEMYPRMGSYHCRHCGCVAKNTAG